MVSRAFKLRVRRRFRVQQRQAEAQLERNFFRRLERLKAVRYFVINWLLLFVLLGSVSVVQIRALGSYYKTPVFVPGGAYTEGIVGNFTNANPIYATNPVDQVVSHLIFAALYKYDTHGQLVADLAAGPAIVNASGTTYTVPLRHNLTWQDGQPLTANDVRFTYQVIQSPDAQSPLNASWRGITVTAPDAYTITFKLSNTLASFPYSLTTGILPQHLLDKTVMSEMRSAVFNTRSPVGSGAFKWQDLIDVSQTPDSRGQEITLVPFSHYYDGVPKLSSFTVHTFAQQSNMLTSFRKHELTAMAGLDSLPQDLTKDSTVYSYSMPLAAAVMSFFKLDNPILSDGQVRQALELATDRQAILQVIGYPALPVDEPLLRNQLGYDPAYAQAGFNLVAANQLLDQAGWNRDASGARSKAGKPLAFQLVAQNSSEYATIARLLQKQWQAAGAKVDLSLQDGTDFQSTLTSHSYDILLYGISIGNDPDVYAYWDSRQADIRAQTSNSLQTRLNFSDYVSKVADNSLEAGRTRLDPVLRAIKYRGFLQAWHDDIPAVGLYQPRFLYVTRGNVANLSEHRINNAVDRFTTIQDWMIRQKMVSQATQ